MWLKCNLLLFQEKNSLFSNIAIAETKRQTKQDETEQQSNAKVLMFLFTGVRIVHYKTIMCEGQRSSLLFLLMLSIFLTEETTRTRNMNVPSLNFAFSVEFYA